MKLPINLTYQLDDSQILLPPQVFVHLRSNSWQPVVSVHQNMDEWVDDGRKSGCENMKINKR